MALSHAYRATGLGGGAAVGCCGFPCLPRKESIFSRWAGQPKGLPAQRCQSTFPALPQFPPYSSLGREPHRGLRASLGLCSGAHPCASWIIGNSSSCLHRVAGDLIPVRLFWPRSFCGLPSLPQPNEPLTPELWPRSTGGKSFAPVLLGTLCSV